MKTKQPLITLEVASFVTTLKTNTLRGGAPTTPDCPTDHTLEPHCTDDHGAKTDPETGEISIGCTIEVKCGRH